MDITLVFLLKNGRTSENKFQLLKNDDKSYIHDQLEHCDRNIEDVDKVNLIINVKNATLEQINYVVKNDMWVFNEVIIKGNDEEKDRLIYDLTTTIFSMKKKYKKKSDKSISGRILAKVLTDKS